MHYQLSFAIIFWVSNAAIGGEIGGERYENTKLGVEFTSPTGWWLSRHSGIPNILARLHNPSSGGHMSVALDRRDREPISETRLASWIERNLEKLRSHGYRFEGIRSSLLRTRKIWRVEGSTQAPVRIDSTFDTNANEKNQSTRSSGENYHLVQYYVAFNGGRSIFIFTLATPLAVSKKHELDLLYLVETLKIDPSGDLGRDNSGAIPHR